MSGKGRGYGRMNLSCRMQPELTNEQRPYFGLHPVQADWERIAVGKDVVAFRDGTLIRKLLQYDIYTPGSYREADYNIILNATGELLPASGKGPARKFNASNLKKYQPISYTFYYHKNYLLAVHRQFHHIVGKACGVFTDWQGAQVWIKQFIASRPANHFAVLDAFRFSKPPRLTYRAGDIFAFTFSNGQYGFCRLLLDVNLLRHTKWLTSLETHNLNRIGATIAIAEVVDIRKDEPVITALEYISQRRFPPLFLADEYVRNGCLPIVAHAPVLADDLNDLPQAFETFYSSKDDAAFHSFQWGLPSVRLSFKSELKGVEKEGANGLRPLVHLEQEGFFACAERHLLPKYAGEFYTEGDLRHPKYQRIREKILVAMGLPPDCSYDSFCQHFGYPTRQELLDWQLAQLPSRGM
jgi:hypothetical protein